MAKKPRKRTYKASGRAYGYVRVSTEDQARSGLGLEAQAAAIRQAADRLGLGLVEVVADRAVSGATAAAEREGAARLLHELLKRGDVVLVAKRDRLGRELAEVVLFEREITRRGCRVISAAGEGTDNDDPSQIMFRTVLDAMAQYERALIGARTRAALRAKVARGERAGMIAFGYQAEGQRLVPNLAEQAVIRAVLATRETAETQRAAVQQLRAQGVVSPRSGRPLILTQCQRIWQKHGGWRDVEKRQRREDDRRAVRGAGGKQGEPGRDPRAS